MLNTYVTIDDDAHPFETLRGNNHGDIAIGAQVLFNSGSIQCQHNNTPHSKGQKLPPSIKYYLFFQTDVKTARS